MLPTCRPNRYKRLLGSHTSLKPWAYSMTQSSDCTFVEASKSCVDTFSNSAQVHGSACSTGPDHGVAHPRAASRLDADSQQQVPRLGMLCLQLAQVLQCLVSERDRLCWQRWRFCSTAQLSSCCPAATTTLLPQLVSPAAGVLTAAWQAVCRW